MIPSFAATALTPTLPASLVITVPAASGCMVFNNLTGTFSCCAGQIHVGCKIFAPKYANSAASSKLNCSMATVLLTIRGSLLCIPSMSVHISQTLALIAAATNDAV